MPRSSILYLLGIASRWFSWRTPPPAGRNCADQTVGCRRVLSIFNPPACSHWLHRILGTGFAKTCTRSQPNIARGRSPFTSFIMSCDQKIGVTTLARSGDQKIGHLTACSCDQKFGHLTARSRDQTIGLTLLARSSDQKIVINSLPVDVIKVSVSFRCAYLKRYIKPRVYYIFVLFTIHVYYSHIPVMSCKTTEYSRNVDL